MHPQTFINDDLFESKKQRDEGEKDSSSGEASLKVLQQPTIDDAGIKMMVPQSEADLEIEVVTPRGDPTHCWDSIVLDLSH